MDEWKPKKNKEDLTFHCQNVFKVPALSITPSHPVCLVAHIYTRAASQNPIRITRCEHLFPTEYVGYLVSRLAVLFVSYTVGDLMPKHSGVRYLNFKWWVFFLLWTEILANFANRKNRQNTKRLTSKLAIANITGRWFHFYPHHIRLYVCIVYGLFFSRLQAYWIFLFFFSFQSVASDQHLTTVDNLFAGPSMRAQ